MEKIECLDIVFFQSISDKNIVSNFIEDTERIVKGDGTFSHVALVVNKDIISTLNVPDNEFYLWQSGLDINAEDNQVVFGTLFTRFAIKSTYKIYTGKLIDNPLKKKNDEDDETYRKRLEEVKFKLNELHEKYFEYPYEYSPIDCLGFLFPVIRKLTCHIFDTKAIVCSEFLTIILQELGVLDKRILANEMIPVNFSDTKTCSTYNKQFIPEKIVDNILYLK